MWSVDGVRPRREEGAAEEQTNEALEKLNERMRETKRMVQLQTIELAQEYFSCSVEIH